MTTSRRRLLIGAAGLAAIAWSWQRFGVQKVKFAFEPLPGLPGWQIGQAGGMTAPGGSATSAVFVGIGTDTVDPLPASELCETLYTTPGPGTPVAVFTDAFCPNCRVMDPMLASREDLALTWHELPLLGPGSERVARAMLAAELQGKSEVFRRELLKTGITRRPTATVGAARTAGLDIDRLQTDMESDAVTARLRTTRATAQTLGIWGTPAIAIGTTLVLGRLSSSELDHLLTLPLGRCR